MEIQKINNFSIIGIAVRTTNENGQSGKDIPLLWSKFMSEGVIEKIPNKIDNTLYCMYTDYEKDHTKPYTTILGCKVAGLSNIPERMIGKTIETGNYTRYNVKGNLLQGAVFEAWLKIWATPITRTYTADFEVYGEKAQDPANGEIDIFIAVK
ncbi:GyrI-like domain-containing protein [Ferruginibacter sp. SUN106]|uniref:GyrI-like domain-containing protein n=1 Tax=Ferruginibacter sp. SUN106 TaxID=2978348 RepID=UPI003D359F17